MKLNTLAASALVLAGVVVASHPALSQGAMTPQPRVAPAPQAPAPVRAPTIVPSAPVTQSGAPQGMLGANTDNVKGNVTSGAVSGTTQTPGSPTSSGFVGNGGAGGTTTKSDTARSLDIESAGGVNQTGQIKR